MYCVKSAKVNLAFSALASPLSFSFSPQRLSDPVSPYTIYYIRWCFLFFFFSFRSNWQYLTCVSPFFALFSRRGVACVRAWGFYRISRLKGALEFGGKESQLILYLIFKEKFRRARLYGVESLVWIICF